MQGRAKTTSTANHGDDLKRDKINVQFGLSVEVVSHIEQILNKVAYITKTMMVSAQDTVAIVMCRLYEGLESV